MVMGVYRESTQSLLMATSNWAASKWLEDENDIAFIPTALFIMLLTTDLIHFYLCSKLN